MMTGISREQRSRDERSLIRFLVVFNLILLTAFILTCVYQHSA